MKDEAFNTGKESEAMKRLTLHRIASSLLVSSFAYLNFPFSFLHLSPILLLLVIFALFFFLFFLFVSPFLPIPPFKIFSRNITSAQGKATCRLRTDSHQRSI
jgi:hypothetical protein